MVAHARTLLQIELLKNYVIQGSYVQNIVKIDPKIASQSCPQTPDERQTR